MNAIVPPIAGLTVAVSVTPCPLIGVGLFEVSVVVIATRLTVMVSRVVGPARPAAVPSREACTVKSPTPTNPSLGVNFRPVAACASETKSPFWIGVTPSDWYSVPCSIPVIWKLVTPFGPYGLGVMTRPELDCWLTIVYDDDTFGGMLIERM